MGWGSKSSGWKQPSGGWPPLAPSSRLQGGVEPYEAAAELIRAGEGHGFHVRRQAEAQQPRTCQGSEDMGPKSGGESPEAFC